MIDKNLIKKLTQKKEFSKLPERDVEIAFKKFNKQFYTEKEKIKLVRDFLRKIFSAFGSQKLLSVKKIESKKEEWFLRKHLSTRERLPYYVEIYKRCLKRMKKKISIIDLGAGINGFSYFYFENLGYDVEYIAIEAVGQFVDLMNLYFKKHKKKAKAVHLSLFEVERIKKIIKDAKSPRVVFLFKVIDSLEAMEKDYSKKLLLEISKISNRVVLSYATKSMIKRKKFLAKRRWINKFIEENFNIIDEFEFAGERYIVFEGR